MASRHPYFTLLLLWLAHFAVDLMIGIWPIYKTMLGIDLALVGAVTAFGVIIGEGMQLLFGGMSDSGYRKAVLLFGLTATAAAVFYPFATSLMALFPLFLLTSIGSGAFHPAAASVVTTLSNRRRALFMALFSSGGMAGMASSQLLFTASCRAFSNNALILAVPSLVLTLLLAFLCKGLSSEKRQGRGINLRAIARFFQRRELVSLYMLQVANQTIFWALVFLLPDLFSSRGSSEWITYGGGHFALIMGCACMAVPSGYLADRYSPKRVLSFATAISFISFYLLLLSPELENRHLLPLLFVMGASLGICNPISIALGNQMMPDSPGVVSAALMGLVWVVSEGLGPGGGGLLSKMFVDDAPAKALMVLGLFYLLSLALIRQLPDSDGERELLPAAGG